MEEAEFPAIQTEFGFSSDACGKIGPDTSEVRLGRLYRQGEEDDMEYCYISQAVRYNDENVNVWMAGLRTFVPIIPEKKGDKTNALAFSAIGYVGQNAWPWLGPPAPGVGSYWRPNNAGASGGLPTQAVSPTMYGGFAQLTYYINNETYVNAQYGVLKQNYSSAARNGFAYPAGTASGETNWAGTDAINQFRVYGASIFNDPSPAVRIGFEWLRMVSNYNGYGRGAFPGQSQTPTIIGTGNLDSSGKNDQFKALIMYFF